MAIGESLLPEFDQETATTRKLLEVIPGDKLAWKPHERSMTLGQLASHLADLLGWSEVMIAQDAFDVAPPDQEAPAPQEMRSRADILGTFDANAAKARELIASTSDEDFMKMWTLKKSGEALFSMPRIAIIRSMLMNHMVHHRAQLGVFLRLNDVPVPQSYGPTADFPDM